MGRSPARRPRPSLTTGAAIVVGVIDLIGREQGAPLRRVSGLSATASLAGFALGWRLRRAVRRRRLGGVGGVGAEAILKDRDARVESRVLGAKRGVLGAHGVELSLHRIEARRQLSHRCERVHAGRNLRASRAPGQAPAASPSPGAPDPIRVGRERLPRCLTVAPRWTPYPHPGGGRGRLHHRAFDATQPEPL